MNAPRISSAPKNSPEENFVLVLIRHLEIAEDDEKYKEVVDAERQLDHVASHELERLEPSMPEQHQHRKRGGQRDPNSRPGQRFAQTDAVGRRFSTPRSSASIATTNRLKRIQKTSTGNLTRIGCQVSGLRKTSVVCQGLLDSLDLATPASIHTSLADAAP